MECLELTLCEACLDEVHPYALTDVGKQICPLCLQDFKAGMDYLHDRLRGVV